MRELPFILRSGGRLAEWLLLGLLALFLLLPLIPLVLWSLAGHWPWPEVWPPQWSGKSWAYLFSTTGRAWEGLLNSWLVACLTLVFNLLLGVPAARTLAMRRFRGWGWLFGLFLAPLFVPFTVTVMGMHLWMSRWPGEFLFISVAIAHVLPTLPYFIAILWYQYRLLGGRLQEAARTLGASSWQIFRWVELPLLWPGLAMGSVLVVLISLSQYITTWVASGGTLLTLPLLMFPFASSGKASLVAVYSLWYMWPVLCLYLVYLWAAGRTSGK